MTRSEILQISKPILFNTEMVRAILDGRKTVTRRVIKPQPDKEMPDNHNICRMPLLVNDEIKNLWYMDVIEQYPFKRTRYFEQFEPYSPGNYLYVRESFAPNYFDGELRGNRNAYKADYYKEKIGDVVPEPKWTPSIHMPKEAARIFLRVTGVSVERLQEIDGNEILAEGMDNGKSNSTMGKRWENMQRMKFENLWDSTIPSKARDKYGWAANPWVFVIEFERVEVTE